jgi:hypothetical protein
MEMTHMWLTDLFFYCFIYFSAIHVKMKMREMNGAVFVDECDEIGDGGLCSCGVGPFDDDFRMKT